MNAIIDAIQQGGPWMYPIIIAFVVALAIAAERIVAVLKAKSNKTALMDEVQKSIMSGSQNKAIQLCSTLAEKKQILPAVLLAGLQAANRDPKAVQAAVDQATLEQFPALTKRMPFLPMLANVATLAGLLGTIIGLIGAFEVVGSPSVPADQKQGLLAQQISIAMFTTAGGLVVAIPTLIINSILTSMISGIMDEVDQSAADLVNRIRANSSKAAK